MATFDTIQADFFRMTHEIIWCTVTTVDTDGRPRSRILHPLWELEGDRPVGWIFTSPTPIKARHLSANPILAFSYWAPSHNVVQGEATATWVEDPAVKKHVWDLFATTPPPLGYDLTAFGISGPDHPGFTALRLDPDRIQILDGAKVAAGDFKPTVATLGQAS
ncbi:pyridoxamine 5'-phosphate oxidase family protein [Nocardia uniformis]|uniref:Pyridoxamine 5'-phosphate oxidase family protein n=1 Tax=Nocardia uniformis TaxID=53432 RepID=A0A849C8K4_9NOCA|nr:pyridoxamine 5'-phosphate oxidase family protein [Nocardia uniformis]NNH72700.1 pyridoxamine 5'-phosphate oxidase family protein [Nocardia uniformis]